MHNYYDTQPLQDQAYEGGDEDDMAIGSDSFTDALSERLSLLAVSAPQSRPRTPPTTYSHGREVTSPTSPRQTRSAFASPTSVHPRSQLSSTRGTMTDSARTRTPAFNLNINVNVRHRHSSTSRTSSAYSHTPSEYSVGLIHSPMQDGLATPRHSIDEEVSGAPTIAQRQNSLPFPPPGIPTRGYAPAIRVHVPTPIRIPSVAPIPIPAPAAPVAAAPAPAAPAPAAPAAPVDPAVRIANNEHIEPYDRAHYDKWYAVVAGTRIGVFKRWEETSRYVIGVPYSRYKGHRTYNGALDYYTAEKAADRVEVLDGPNM